MRFFACLLTLLVSTSVFAEAPSGDALHAPFNVLLKANVRGDKVNYAGFKGNAQFKAYLAVIASADPSSMSKQEQLAFWINAYNASMINVVISNPGMVSVQNVMSPDFEIFKASIHKVAGQMVSLNKIENEIIRPTFKDPRIHAAVNCASISCPPLANFAFVGSKVNAQLRKVFKRFARDRARNQISAGQIKLSQIFNWYAGDFTAHGGVTVYLTKYLRDGAEKAALAAGPIQFMDYNWMLNGL